MARAVYIHVGVPKTGTTYLQSTLWANKSELASAGVLVPGRRQFDAFHASQAIREIPWLHELPPARRDSWLRIQREIAAWAGDAVLSHEFLGGASQRQSAAAIAALSPAQVNIVLTARDYVALMPAMWQESVKMGGQSSLEAYTDQLLEDGKPGPWGRASADILGVLDRWGASLPPDRVHVVTVAPSPAQPDLLWRRFATVCGIDPSRFPTPTLPENQAMSLADTMLVQQVAAHLPPGLRAKRMRHRWLRGLLAQRLLAGRAGGKPALAPDSARRVREWGLQTVAGLSDRGYDIVGDLQDLVSSPVTSRAEPHPLAPELIAESAAWTIAALLDEYRRLSEDRDILSREIRDLRRELGVANAAGSTEVAPTWSARALGRVRTLSESLRSGPS